MIIVRGACPRAAQSADPGADDVVAGFEHEADARRFLDALRARFGEFALSLHPEKTRLIEFGRHAATRRAQRGLGKLETFNFLGFTVICGQSRQGRFLLKRRTRRDRMRAKLQEIKGELIVPGISVWKLRRSIKLVRLLPFLLGAAIRVPIGVELLHWCLLRSFAFQ
jgi:hypothetical protein